MNGADQLLHCGVATEIEEIHQYIHAGGKLLRETITEGETTRTLDFVYDNAGNPYSLIYNNGTTTTTYYYITNLQGDVMYLVDASGSEVAAYDYDPYGKVITSTGELAEVNPLRYRGYYYDTETGFYYLQSRYYDPEICRFINADSYASTGQGFLGLNMFAYCNNNPVMNSDALGTLVYYTVKETGVELESTDKNGTSKYVVTIKYTCTVVNESLLIPDVTLEGTETFCFEIDNRGVVMYDNEKQNSPGMITDHSISNALGQAIYDTARQRDPESLSGRTASGIAYELQQHYRFSRVIPTRKLLKADIGGMDKSRADYDYNAIIFERPLHMRGYIDVIKTMVKSLLN